MRQRTALKNLKAWRQNAIRAMKKSRRATLRFLAAMPRSEILRPRTQGKWSVRDVFAHFIAWEREGTERLRLIARGQAHQIVFYTSLRAADRFNARAVARGTSWPALLRQAVGVRRQLISALRRLPAAALNDRTQRWPVVAWLPEFAWTHEQEHLRRIRGWWQKRRSELARAERRAR